MTKIYIDGQEGTTGLKILERFKGRNDIELLRIDENKRKDNDERKRMINSADFTFLCLPDAAAREAVAMADDKVRIIDASTAHRTNPDWAYGFPELARVFRERVSGATRAATAPPNSTVRVNTRSLSSTSISPKCRRYAVWSTLPRSIRLSAIFSAEWWFPCRCIRDCSRKNTARKIYGMRCPNITPIRSLILAARIIWKYLLTETMSG